MLITSALLAFGAGFLTGGAGGNILARRKLSGNRVRLIKRPAQRPAAASDGIAPADPDADLDADNRGFRLYLTASTAALGLATAGRFVHPLLGPLALVPLTVALVPIVRRELRSLRSGGHAAVAIVELGAVAGLLALGYVAATAIALILILGGQWLVRRTEDRSRHRLFDIQESLPGMVWVERGDVEVELPLADVGADEVIVVAAGTTVPVDGVVLSGVGRVDERALTGEAQLVERAVGDPVKASTLLVQGRLRVRVEHAGQDCLAGQIVRILNSSSDYRLEVRSRGQRIVERGATPTLALSALALVLRGPVPALAVLFASFGYTMRYAAPVAVLGYLERAMHQGILVKDGRALERLDGIDTVVFDKTGTLTEDALDVARVHVCGNLSEDEVLALAAAAEQRQSHPIAQAIRAAAAGRGLNIADPSDVEVEIGAGLRVSVAGHQVLVGSERLMQHAAIELPAAVAALQTGCADNGTALVLVGRDRAVVGALELAARIRPEAAAIIRRLRGRGLDLCVLSGDQEAPTRTLAEHLGIPHHVARVLPHEKAAAIRRMQAQGKRVCFVGDGINDAIALREADVAVSLAGASTVATDSAPLVLMDGTLMHLPAAFELATALRANLDVSTALSIAPGVVSTAGVFVGVIGVGGAFAAFNLALLATLVNGLRPSIGLDKPTRHAIPDPIHRSTP